jgi:hypothetical protein
MRGSVEDRDRQWAAADDLDTVVAGLYRLPLAELVVSPVTGWSGNREPLATARPPVA